MAASDPNVTISFTGESSAAVRTTDALTSALTRLTEAGRRATHGISGLNSSLGRTAQQTHMVGNLGAEYAKVGTALQNVSRQTAQSIAGFNSLANAAKRAGESMSQGAASGKKQAGAANEKASGGLTALLGGGSGLRGMLATTAALTGVSVSMAAAGNEARKLITENMALDKAMSAVAAVGGLDKQGAEYGRLTDMVREYGRSTQYSSIQAATGLRELIAAGYNAKESTKLLGDTLDLAAADNLEMSRASEILVANLQAMHLGIDQSTRVVNVLARAANASTASIDDLGESLKYAAPLSKAVGIEFETTAAALAMLANNGVRGGMAGRGFGAMIARMVAPTEDVVNLLAKANIGLSEINPEIVGLEAAFKRLQGVDTKTLTRLFGVENLDVASIMISNSNALGALEAKMRDASITAKGMALTMSDHLETGFKRVKNAISDIYLSIGKDAYDSLTNGAVTFAKTITEHSGEIVTFGSHIASLTGNLMKLGIELEKIAIGGWEPVVSGIGAGVAVLDAIVAGLTGNLEQPPAPAPPVRPQGVIGNRLPGVNGGGDGEATRKAREAELKQLAAEKEEAVEKAGMEAFKRRTEAEIARDKARVASLSTAQQMVVLLEQEASAQMALAQAKRAGYAGEGRVNAINAQIELIDIEERKAKLLDRALEKQQKMSVTMRALEANEARAAGDTRKADRLDDENRLLERQVALMKDLELDPATAAEIAKRELAAEKKAKSVGRKSTVIADSLQSVGGGGNAYIGGNVADLQLRAQQDIAANTKVMADALPGGVTATGTTGNSGATQMQMLGVVSNALVELRKITENTSKGHGAVTVRRR